MKPGRSLWVVNILCFGYAFLYIPIFSLIVYSFNDSRLASLWGGFSTRWYAKLLQNDAVIDAALLSLQIAAVSATAAAVLGTMAGLALARLGRFRGRLLFVGMITAPLVMPEVITGLSLLLLFITFEGVLGWPQGRGAGTVIIAHITFSMAYVAIIVQSRLSSMDQSVEEAAMDLGARQLRVLWDITLPIIFPAIVAGWLLAFTLSLDDLVIASFTSGPGANTLPMLVFSKVKLGVTPDINAIATLIIGVVAAGVFLAGWLMFARERRQEKDKQLAASGRALQ